MRLSDLVAFSRTVSIGEHAFNVRGLTVTDIASLFERFPELAAVFDQMADQNEQQRSLIQLAQPLSAAIIAAGVGALNDEEQERAAMQLPIGVQTEFIGAILELTLPNGVGPFVETLTRLGIVLRGEPGKAQGTNLPSPSST